MTIIRKSVKEAFEKAIKKKSWQSHLSDYVEYANYHISQDEWQGEKSGVASGGLDGEDIVEIIFIKILEDRLNSNYGVVGKRQFDKEKLDYKNIFQKLIKNGWAEKINSKKVLLTINLDKEKNRMAKIFGQISSKILPILEHSVKDIEFDAFIKMSIRATVNHLATSKENVITVSNYFYSKQAMKVYNILDFVSYPEQCQYEMFPSKMFNFTVEQIISKFLDFIKHDSGLTKVAKILVFDGAVFEECFQNISNADCLIACLTSNGYIDHEGEVQNKFWILGNADEMKLDNAFVAHRKVIFLMISRSINIEKPKDVAEWLHIARDDIYNIKRRMKRHLLLFKKKMGYFNGGKNNEE